MSAGRAALAASAALATLVALVVGGAGSLRAAGPPLAVARDLPGLVKAAHLVLVGDIVDVRPGRVAGEGEARLQFSDVRVRVDKPLKGTPGPELIVEFVATPPGTTVVGLGPPYQRGERYVLFLMPGEGERYVTPPQGRYLLKGGRVQSMQRGPVADKVDGTNGARFIADIEATVGAQPGR